LVSDTVTVHLEEAVWTNPLSGQRIFYRFWRASRARATLIVIHGFAEHSCRYAPFAQALAERGMAVFAADLRGHGRSDGRRGDVSGFERYVDDLAAVTAALGVAVTPGQAGLFGHSLGGLIAIHWSLREPARFGCLCLQAPLLRIGFPVPAWKRFLARQLVRVWPTLALPSGIDPAGLSHDPEVINAYRRDPLVNRLISLRTYVGMLQAMRLAMEQAPQVRPPTLLLYGDQDRIAAPEASRGFFERLGCEKRIVGYPGCFHELHHEAVAPAVLDELARWIDAHV
jgi:alpha-beta hydrolase superfamily lysophospholipase